VWPGETDHPDFTNPAALKWWQDQCEDFYYNYNVQFDALWVDMNEPTNFQPDNPDKLEKMNCQGKYNNPKYIPRILDYRVGLHDKSICMDNNQYWGMHYNAHSLYGHSMALVTYDALQNLFPEERRYVLTRSSFPGSGHKVGTWTGDNQSFWSHQQWSISQIFEFNLFGFAMVGSDICGFYFNTTAELCQRWQQVGAFYPFSRNHNAADMIPQHPTVFGEEVTKSSRNALNIRYSILPYMYTQLYLVNSRGGTIFRALSHEFPNDSETWNIDSQFLLGPAFLVTPVLEEGATTVKGYFPRESRWFDFRSGKEMKSERGKVTILEAPMDYINLHLRGGFILPMQEPDVTTASSRKNDMSLTIAPDTAGTAFGQLYWDDGEQRDVAENYTLIYFTYNQGNLTIEVQHDALDLIELNELHLTTINVMGVSEKPSKVVVDGQDGKFDYFEDTERLNVVDLNLSVLDDHNVVLV
jgi:alpha-glucosidase (family GH31 glycosyl hydrolase)